MAWVVYTGNPRANHGDDIHIGATGDNGETAHVWCRMGLWRGPWLEYQPGTGRAGVTVLY